MIAIESEAEARSCFPLMQVLRPNLNEDEFIERFARQKAEGYKLIACLDDSKNISALAGYRFLVFMAWGKILYLDDLITDPEKTRSGYGGALLDWLEDQAKINGCSGIHLDTGYGRQDAHRLYLKKGMELNSHHLAKEI